jgi:hypothetical protein
MRNIYLYLLLVSAIFSMALLSCRQSSQQPGDIPIYTFPPQQNQPGAEPGSSTPVTPLPPDTKGDYIVRNIVVDERNSIFSIGIPAGYREQTEVTAQKPIDFWFEYLLADAKLEVNGVEVQRDPFRWETKIKYTTSTFKFEYQITNKTGNSISYNLHLVPTVPGQSVPVVVRQRWIP